MIEDFVKLLLNKTFFKFLLSHVILENPFS